MAKIVFDKPTADSPGFVKRLRRTAKFELAIKAGKFDMTLLDELIEFLLEMVVEPADKNEARPLMEELSQKELFDALSALTGGGSAPQIEPPLANSAPSEPGREA